MFLVHAITDSVNFDLLDSYRTLDFKSLFSPSYHSVFIH